MSDSEESRYVLGLDLGVSSVGWALVRFDGKRPITIEDAGSRIFECAMTNDKGEISQGKEESRNKARRDKRLIRRQLDRRARKLRGLALLLSDEGLLPGADLSSSQNRHEYLVALDREIAQRHLAEIPEENHHRFHNTLPYWLRARALETRLEADELGRVFYHFGQRRGFLSNRKTDRDDDEKSVVYEGISDLEEQMSEARCETLGQYFANLDPTDDTGRRIRKHYTHRRMFEAEFEAIWRAQQPHHPELLTEEFRKRLHRRIFFQRKLKSARHLRGLCEYECEDRGAERDRPRAPWALELSQRFRCAQAVSNLEYELPDGTSHRLTDEQRGRMLAHLNSGKHLNDGGYLSYAEAKKLLAPPKGLGKGVTLNLERDGGRGIRGNSTAQKLYSIFGDRLDEFTPEDRLQAVEDLRSYEKEGALAKRGRERWGLSAEAAKRFSQIQLEPDYAGLSRQAMEKLLPLMEGGTHYMSAVIEVYGDQTADWHADRLPSLRDAPFGEIRNPTVSRILTELRKVVNHIIDTYGLPDEIRIELARDAKRSKQERAKLNKKMRDREKERAGLLKEIRDTVDSNYEPSRDDMTRVLLWKECNGKCPYTGRSISMGQLLGAAPQFQIEHIIPFSRSLDNSFLNKTLCYHETNYAKANKTPYEAFSDDEEWPNMLARVADFKGDAAQEKLRRFKMRGKELETFIEDFKSSQLNDTRYASRLAMEYLRILYAGDWRKHIRASKGTITAELRNAWKLNGILNDGGEKKSREDHRHHAVDAIAIALASPDMVQVVSQAAQMAEKEGHRRWWKVIQEPWDGFLRDATAAIERIVVSHAPNRVVRGGLHKETNYSPDKENPDGKRVVHVRKALANLTSGEVQNIVDPAVKACVLEKMAELGKSNPAEAFKSDANLPRHKNGKIIRKARVAKTDPTIPVGRDERVRYVSPGNNHHIEIFEVADKKGNPKWEGRVVSMYECCRRRAKGLPVVDRTHPDGGQFVFSLCGGDMVEMLDEGENKALYVVRGISEFSSGALVIDFLKHNDARGISKVPRAGRTKVPNVMLQAECKKVTVSPLGEVRYARD